MKNAYLGIDIGSISTKGVIIDDPKLLYLSYWDSQITLKWDELRLQEKIWWEKK